MVKEVMPGERLEVELKMAEILKREVREENKIPDKGIVIKTIKRHSPATFNYEAIGTPSEFIKKLEGMASKINTRSMVEIIKKNI